MNARLNLLIRCAAVVVGGLLAGSALADPPATQDGVWQKHEYDFHYMGFTTTYSCDGLAGKLKRLLVLSGARADAKAMEGPCSRPTGPDKFASARIVFYTLVPAGTAGASGEPGQGAWRPVSLAALRPVDLQRGDCELVEQFRDTVLKKMFSIRDLRDNTRCIPHQESGTIIALQFESFAPVAAVKGRAP